MPTYTNLYIYISILRISLYGIFVNAVYVHYTKGFHSDLTLQHKQFI